MGSVPGKQDRKSCGNPTSPVFAILSLGLLDSEYGQQRPQEADMEHLQNMHVATNPLTSPLHAHKGSYDIAPRSSWKCSSTFVPTFPPILGLAKTYILRPDLSN